MNTTQKGAQAEEQAARFLTRKGLTIVARNFRAAGGEIDLVATQAGTLIFVEVKKRTSRAFGGPVAAVTPAKQRRIATAAAQFIKAHPAVHYQSIRFDVVSILPQETAHLENAFFPPRSTL